MMKVTRLEQTAAIRLLFYLHDKKESKTGEIVHNLKGTHSQNTIYRALNVLMELGLVEEVLDPPRRIFRLTEKGKKVLEKLMEVEKILSS